MTMSDRPLNVVDDDGCKHSKVVPYGDGTMGRCTECGDETFPLVDPEGLISARLHWCECGQPWIPAAGLYGTTEETRCCACVLRDMVAALRVERDGAYEHQRDCLGRILEAVGEVYVEGHDTFADDAIPAVLRVVRERDEARAERDVYLEYLVGELGRTETPEELVGELKALDRSLVEQMEGYQADRDRLAAALDRANAINFHSAENESDTPDFVLADYLIACLDAFDDAARARTVWHSSDRNEPTDNVQPRPT